MMQTGRWKRDLLQEVEAVVQWKTPFPRVWNALDDPLPSLVEPTLFAKTEEWPKGTGVRMHPEQTYNPHLCVR